jgi:magnesium and cobalt transporter
LDDDTSEDKTDFWRRLGEKFLPGRRRVRSEQELQEVIDASEEEGIINEEEGEMLQSIFEFGATIVREIMVPRTDMVCCGSDAAVAEVLQAIIASGHSRIPIYQGSADRIIGLVYAKDLLKYWGRAASEVDIGEIMRAPFFVPETKKIEELLKEFRSRRMHMAIAVDEYGGTSGLVTIEDLIEEIVGDIQDEYDLEEVWLQEEGDGCVLVDGRLNIEELEDYFGLTVDRERFDTVGGWLFHLLGRVPVKGEEVRAQGLLLTVEECDERKIHKIRVRRETGPPGAAEA